jgi:hypothetical protein
LQGVLLFYHASFGENAAVNTIQPSHSLQGLSDDLFINFRQVFFPFDCLKPFLYVFTLMPKVTDHKIDVVLLARSSRVEFADIRLEICEERFDSSDIGGVRCRYAPTWPWSSSQQTRRVKRTIHGANESNFA